MPAVPAQPGDRAVLFGLEGKDASMNGRIGYCKQWTSPPKWGSHMDVLLMRPGSRDMMTCVPGAATVEIV